MIIIYVNAVKHWQTTVVTRTGVIFVNAIAFFAAHVTGVIPCGIDRAFCGFLATQVAKMVVVGVGTGGEGLVTLLTFVIAVLIVAIVTEAYISNIAAVAGD